VATPSVAFSRHLNHSQPTPANENTQDDEEYRQQEQGGSKKPLHAQRTIFVGVPLIHNFSSHKDLQERVFGYFSSLKGLSHKNLALWWDVAHKQGTKICFP
jgi:hypothetical protein